MYSAKATMRIFVLVCFFGITPGFVHAEEQLGDILKRVSELHAEGKYVQAMNELSWASKELEKLHLEKLKAFFPKGEGGFTAGDFQSNNALGFVALERTYNSTSGGSVTASLTGSASTDGAAAQGMGALAGFARMAEMMDTTGQSEAVRVKGMRATVKNMGGQFELSLPLSSGMFFTLKPNSGTVTKEQLVTLANGLDSDGLNSYLTTR